MRGKLWSGRGGAELGGFRPGDVVKVLPTKVHTHHRTPGYVKGKIGRIAARSGRFYDPETRAYGGSGLPKRELYLVEFDMKSLWGNQYRGREGDTVLIDLYENWLEPVTASSGN
ncbi:MAG: nitrile hydratase subunit beta [bacterium]|nr:nitrile hydratase subunit beta [Acidimicrobiia bacterium]MCY4649479.1 nitrile hydratase subunit beta [bacterium]